MEDILKDKFNKKVLEKIKLAKQNIAEKILIENFAAEPGAPGGPRPNLGIYDPKRYDEKFITKQAINDRGVVIPKNTTIRVVRSNVSYEIYDIFWHTNAGNVGNQTLFTASVNISHETFMQWKEDDLLEPVVPTLNDVKIESRISFSQFNRLKEDVVKDLRKIIKYDESTYVTFKDKSTIGVDVITARNIIQVLDGLSSQNRIKMAEYINAGKESFLVMTDFAFKNAN